MREKLLTHYRTSCFGDLSVLYWTVHISFRRCLFLMEAFVLLNYAADLYLLSNQANHVGRDLFILKFHKYEIICNKID